MSYQLTFGMVRRTICRNCRSKCATYMRGQVKFDDNTATCEQGVWGRRRASEPNTPPPGPRSRRVIDYLALWRAIHIPTLTDSLTDAALAAVIAQLPSCCRPSAQAYVDKNPLPTSGQFAWGVAFHNDVRARQNKAQLTEAEALQAWEGQSPS